MTNFANVQPTTTNANMRGLTMYNADKMKHKDKQLQGMQRAQNARADVYSSIVLPAATDDCRDAIFHVPYAGSRVHAFFSPPLPDAYADGACVVEAGSGQVSGSPAAISDLEHDSKDIDFAEITDELYFNKGALQKFWGCASMYIVPKQTASNGIVSQSNSSSPYYLAYCAGSSVELGFKPLRCVFNPAGFNGTTIENQWRCSVPQIGDLTKHQPNYRQPVIQTAVFGGFRGAGLVPQPTGTQLKHNLTGEMTDVKGVIVMFPAVGNILGAMVVFDPKNDTKGATASIDPSKEVFMTMPLNSLQGPWAAQPRLFDRAIAVPNSAALAPISLQCKQLGLGILSWYQAETLAYFQSDRAECQVTYTHNNSNSSIGMPHIYSAHTDQHGRACFLTSQFVKSCANEKEHPDQDDYACCQGTLFATWNLTVEEK
jgi:hypothetical protein